jgi:MOSC domain
MPLQSKLSFTGKVEQLLARESRNDGFDKQQRQNLSLKFSGPEGDCHTGLTRQSDSRTMLTYKRNTPIRNVRQLTMISVEEMDDVAKAMGLDSINASWLGANVVTSGIPDLTMLPPSTRLQFSSGATVVVDMENMPCRQVNDEISKTHPEQGPKFVKAATHKRGLTVWVEREGDIKIGDTISLFIPPQRIYQYS